MFLDSFFAPPRSPLTIDPDSPEGAIVRFHDTACEGITRAIGAAAGALAEIVAGDGGPGDAGARADIERLVPDSPNFPRLLRAVLAGDAARRSAIVRAASLAEFMQVVDSVVARFAGLAINHLGSVDTHRTASCLAPVLVHAMGLADAVAGDLLGAGVPPRVADLAAALQAGDTSLFQPFYQVFLAWKSDPIPRLLGPPGRDGSVASPFTSMARAAVAAGGSPATLTAALRTNLLLIESVERSGHDLSAAEARYLLEETRRCAELEREAAKARSDLAARRGPGAGGSVPPRPGILDEQPRSGPCHAGLPGVVLRGFAALSVLDHRVTADEIWTVLDAMQPVGLDIKEVHDLFIAACRAVHREGVETVARQLGTELRETLDAGAGGFSREGLWRAFVHVAELSGGDAGSKAAILRELRGGLGLG